MGMITPSSAVPSITAGERGISIPLAQLIPLWIRGLNSASTNKSTARLFAGTAGYQVPAGRTLRIFTIGAFHSGASLVGPKIGYADNDTGWCGNTAATNPMGAGGSDFTVFDLFPLPGSMTAWQWFHCVMDIPATKYVAAEMPSTVISIAQLWGYLI